ncbi:lipase (class 3) domain-containing protein [Hirsutella rhossiliensis]|uniref:Lipase (Class 3) domain-containing protein n=1 Tax=Hirsutella rhossiliensis TaxID=111463 RepID=A0A9P8N2L6_9HYPO|nr:lipase (class 3) domain-containing protein [Hirsutella rhossiliensis]KAH0964709.1 lipase (class 3) domain-containing protein [Hirsutella rhossiliensis]
MGFFNRSKPIKAQSSHPDHPGVHLKPPSPPALPPRPITPAPLPSAHFLVPAVTQLPPPPCWSFSALAPKFGPGSAPPPWQRWCPRQGKGAGSAVHLVQPCALAGDDDGGDEIYSDVCSRFDDVVTLIDREEYAGHEADLFLCPSSPAIKETTPPPTTDRSLGFSKLWPSLPHKNPDAGPLQATTAVVSGKYFSKVELYANSKLPLALSPFALCGSSWPPLLRLAAQCSLRVYSPPTGPERRQAIVVPADWRSGSKAMYIRSVPADAARTVVVAVRGTASFADWAVNLRADPVSPLGFLDDPGNACHAGFLSVARAMVAPVARRLREMLEDDPSRADHSLVFTGHSAGGAVAALLYMHMLAACPDAQSDLTVLAGCFRRVHCLTFGAPPVSLLPLAKPNRPELRKSLFLSFVNEGDPVTRADKAFVKSLFTLLKSPPPSSAGPIGDGEKKKKNNKDSPPAPQPYWSPPVWTVPPSTLSNAGCIVLLRSGDPYLPPVDRKSVQDRLHEGVVAVTCRDDQLRGVIWGDPVCHLMRLYAVRVEALAAAAEMAGKTSP